MQFILTRLINSNLIILSCLILLQACGGIPDKDQLLEQARSAYEKAESMPATAEQRYSLEEAKIALQQAEKSDNARDIKEFARIAIEKSKLVIRSEESDFLTTLSHDRRKIAPPIHMKSYENRHEAGFLLPSQALFDENQKELQHLAEIKKIAQFLKKNPRQQALIEGHTSSQGSTDFNHGLSYRQANAVRFALMRQGIASNRLIVKGLGSSRPIASSHTKNQRIQVTISNAIGLAANE